MYKNYAVFLLILFSLSSSAQTVLWSEGFEGVTSLNCNSKACGSYPSCLAGPPTNFTCLPAGWLTKVDYPWGASSNSGVAHNYSNPSQVKYVYLSGWVNYRNQWLIAPGTAMTAGLTYRLKFWFKTSNESCTSGCGNGFNFFVGTSTSQTTLPSSTQQVVSQGRNTTWQEFSYDFTPSVSNTYYFGINTTYTSYTTNNWAYLDDISVTEICTAPVAGFTFGYTGNTVNFINTSQFGATYTWNFGDGSPTSGVLNPSHTYTVDGKYVVTLIVTNACGTDTITDSVNIITTHLNALRSMGGLSIYPNPAKERFVITMDEVLQESELLIQDITGRELLRERIYPAMGVFVKEVDAAVLPKGIYILRLLSGNDQFIQKLILE